MPLKDASAETSERLQFAVEADAAAPNAVAMAQLRQIARDPSSRPEPTVRATDAPRRAPVALSRLPTLLTEALATEWERGTAFHFLPVLLAAGSLTYFALPAEPGFGPLALGVTVTGALALLARSNLPAWLAFVTVLAVLLGMLFGKVETWRAGTKMLGGEITTKLTGRVAVIEHLANGRMRLTLDVVKTERPVLRYAPDRVRVSARNIPGDLAAGDAVAGVVRLMPPSGPLRPGGYDFSFESYFDGIGANGFYLRGPEIVAGLPEARPAAKAFAWVENTRAALAARIEASIEGEAEGEIAAALVAGVRAGIPEEVNEALRRTGLAHVLSISGLHMALVSLTIMGLIRTACAFFPDFASRHAVKKYAAAVALVALAVYLFISGSAVAAERSFVMIAVMLSALLIDRSALTMRNLAIAAIVILAVSPHEAAGPSFQMSFAATAALIGAYAAWSERKNARTAPAANGQGIVRWAGATGLRYFGGLAATSLIAGAATALYGAYHFQRVSTLGLAANLAAMPVVSIVVMPFAVFGMILMPFGLDGWAFAIMGKGLSWMIAIADWFAARSPLDAVGMIPPSAVAVMTVGLVVATLLTTWLRVLALPFFAAGLALLMVRPMPDLFVSEDGRLVALRTSTELAVNRTRPNAFTVENWQMALNTGTLAKPIKLETTSTRIDGQAVADQGFVCAGNVCAARHASGALVVHAQTAEDAWPYCGFAALIVIDDATASDACATSGTLVVTKRDLAQKGSAAIMLTADDHASIEQAIETAYRPWHDHRRFSREARGLPPYQRRQPEVAPGGASEAQ